MLGFILHEILCLHPIHLSDRHPRLSLENDIRRDFRVEQESLGRRAIRDENRTVVDHDVCNS